MPETKTYRCPVSPRARYCKKVLVSEVEAKRRCVLGTIRTTAVKAGVLKRTCRTRKAGPRGGRTMILSLLKLKSEVKP